MGVAPRRRAATSATWNSGRLPMSITIRSPGPTPSARRPAAARVARSAYSSKVRTRTSSPTFSRSAISPPRSVTVRRNRAGMVSGAATASRYPQLRVENCGSGVENLAEMGKNDPQFVPRRSLGRRHRRASLRRFPRDELAPGPARSTRTALAPIQDACSRHARSSRVRWSPCSSSRRPPRSRRSRRPPPRRRPPSPPAPPPTARSPPRPRRRRRRRPRSPIPTPSPPSPTW